MPRKRNPQDASVSKVKQADDTLRDKVKFLGKRLRALENRVREVEARVTERAR